MKSRLAASLRRPAWGRPGVTLVAEEAREEGAVARRLTVLGTGYLGATHAACMAELGFEVLGLDVDTDEDRPAGRG